MDARLQLRIQRYGWDLAAWDYEPLWRSQLAEAQAAVLDTAALAPGERVLDVASGTGLITFESAMAVGNSGSVFGIDLSANMVQAARRRTAGQRPGNVCFARMDAQALDFDDASFDVVLCSLGLMYVPDPDQALREMHRVLRPGGRMIAAVWGERARCGWSALFSIVDAEVASEVCPLFFHLGQCDTLANRCGAANFVVVERRRLVTTLDYADADEACNAAFVGGPVALAWSRLDVDARNRVRARYIEAITKWRCDRGYRVPAEFVIVAAQSGATSTVDSRGKLR
jgi:ubiquinone/menaquinone biosynthesis C-methylase UbiE